MGRSIARSVRTWSRSIFSPDQSIYAHENACQSCTLTVLHDITNNTELIEISTSAFGSEWLLESNLPSRVRKLPELMMNSKVRFIPEHYRCGDGSMWLRRTHFQIAESGYSSPSPCLGNDRYGRSPPPSSRAPEPSAVRASSLDLSRTASRPTI